MLLDDELEVDSDAWLVSAVLFGLIGIGVTLVGSSIVGFDTGANSGAEVITGTGLPDKSNLSRLSIPVI